MNKEEIKQELIKCVELHLNRLEKKLNDWHVDDSYEELTSIEENIEFLEGVMKELEGK